MDHLFILIPILMAQESMMIIDVILILMPILARTVILVNTISVIPNIISPISIMISISISLFFSRFKRLQSMMLTLLWLHWLSSSQSIPLLMLLITALTQPVTIIQHIILPILLVSFLSLTSIKEELVKMCMNLNNRYLKTEGLSAWQVMKPFLMVMTD